MLGLFKAQNRAGTNTKNAYAVILQHIRQPAFYTQYGVPDTFDGRFDLMLLHVFLLINTLLSEDDETPRAFNQSLFDVVFKDMDQTLREMGIGDMGVPKHMRRMMKAFNGRMHAYQTALEEHTLPNALKNNLFGTISNADPAYIEKTVSYIEQNVQNLKQLARNDIVQGKIEFTAP